MGSLAMAKEIDLGNGIVYITDQKNMVDIMSANIILNKTISQIDACELDWYTFLNFHLTKKGWINSRASCFSRYNTCR